MRPHRQDGLTLIELIITIVLATIIGLPVGFFVSEYIKGALNARDTTVAMNLARDEIERLESFNDFCHAELNLTGPLGSTVARPDYPAYVVTRIVSCQTGNCSSNCSLAAPANTDNGMKRIEIRVAKVGSSSTLASLMTYRTKFVLFGS